MISDLELRRRYPSDISGLLIALLSGGDVGSEFLMEFVQVDCELVCACRGEVSFRVEGEVRVITLIGKEGRDACGGVRSVVICELCEQEQV